MSQSAPSSFRYHDLPAEIQRQVLSHGLPQGWTVGEFSASLKFGKEFYDISPLLGCISKKLHEESWAIFLEQNTITIRHEDDIPELLRRLEKGPGTFKDIRSLEYVNEPECSQFNHTEIDSFVDLASQCHGLQELKVGVMREDMEVLVVPNEEPVALSYIYPVLDIMPAADLFRDWHLDSSLVLRNLKTIRFQCWWRYAWGDFHTSEMYLCLCEIVDMLKARIKERWGGEVDVVIDMTPL